MRTSDQRVRVDFFLLDNSKIKFYGFRNKNETCSEGYVLHPIKAHLCQETIFIDINLFTIYELHFLELQFYSDFHADQFLEYFPYELFVHRCASDQFFSLFVLK